MAESLVSTILGHLASSATQELKQLEGVDNEVGNLTSNFQAIQAMIEDAENREVKDSSVRDWLNKLKGVSYDIEDVLDQWNTTSRKIQMKKAENASKLWKKVCSCILSDCLHFKKLSLRHEIASKIKVMNERLGVIATQKNVFNFSLTTSMSQPEHKITTSFIDLLDVHGRDNYKKTLINLLLSESSQAPTLTIVSIVGMGGIGKTTLAQMVFNDDEVDTHFDKKIWVCVSTPFNEGRIAKAILESFTKKAPKQNELETLLGQLRQYLEGKKFLLVLDDVWIETPNSWEQLKDSLKCGSNGSRIIVTTRKESTAKIMGTTESNIISLEKLSYEDSWLLFTRIVLPRKAKEEWENFIDIGRKIVDKCKGLPLALKTLGSLLSFKTRVDQWQCVLDSDLWKFEEIGKELFPPILLSYYDLPSKIRICFLYCALFPKDYVMEKDVLIKMWMAQGYLGNEEIELVGEEYFEKLAMRSLFQDFERSEYDGSIIRCKMHDIVHDCVQSLAKNECFKIEFEGPTIPHFEIPNTSVQHVMIKSKYSSIPPTILNFKLRSLAFENQWGDFILKTSSFEQLSCLRMLNLHWFGRNLNLEGVKYLTHLRYFKLECRNDKLPEILCDLYNLQTLDLSYCNDLIELPQGIGKLVNLRHLLIVGTNSLGYIPKGVERLSSLRTLDKLIISGGDYGNKACTSLHCLKNLKLSQRCLELEFGNVRDINALAYLHSMKDLLHFKLIFRWPGDGRLDEQILRALKPPCNLLKLGIHDYGGTSLSFDLMASLSKLRELELNRWDECEILPPLGKLPSLESLTIGGMHRIKTVGNEFLGIGNDVTLSSSSIVAFPKLKSLHFWALGEWEEWNFRDEKACEEWDYESTNGRDEDITIMPRLHFLKITLCSKLKALPYQILQSRTLQHLEICLCDILGESYEETGDGRSNISHIPKITIYRR